MPRRLHYALGAPCWLDRITGRIAEAEAFYAALFGWRFAAEGSYRMALLNDDIVAGFGSAGPGREFWTVYLAAKDLESTAAELRGAGGTVVLEPMEVGDVGSLLLALDPAGTLVGFWSGNTAEGVVLADEVGAACRYELQVPDPNAVAPFYAAVGLQFVETDGQLGLEADAKTVIDVVTAPDLPPQLQPYFGVTDIASAVRAALTRGATLASPPADGAVTLLDPWGARFGVQHRP